MSLGNGCHELTFLDAFPDMVRSNLVAFSFAFVCPQQVPEERSKAKVLHCVGLGLSESPVQENESTFVEIPHNTRGIISLSSGRHGNMHIIDLNLVIVLSVWDSSHLTSDIST